MSKQDGFNFGREYSGVHTDGLGNPQRARRADPATAKAAGDTIRNSPDRLTDIQVRVLALFGPDHTIPPIELTQHAIIDRYRKAHGDTPESTIRTRVSELVTLHKLAPTGRTVPIHGTSTAMTFHRL